MGRWPWPRLVHASAIDYLRRSGAKVIAYDVLFGEREGARESIVNGQTISGDDSDRLLVEAVRRAGNVVLLGDATFEGLASGKPAETADRPAGAAGPGLPTRRRVPVQARVGPAVRRARRRGRRHRTQLSRARSGLRHGPARAAVHRAPGRLRSVAWRRRRADVRRCGQRERAARGRRRCGLETTRVPTLDERRRERRRRASRRARRCSGSRSRRPAATACDRSFRPTRSTTSCCRKTT